MILAAAGTKTMWYLTRGTGLVALVLLTASVVLGIIESLRWARPGWPRFITAALHRNVSLLVTVFLALHIVTAVADGFAPIGWLDVVLPFGSTYRPIWLGLGTVAFDLLLALIITSLLRARIGYRAWKLVHWAAYACWPVALVHGLGTGTDSRTTWVLWLNLGCLGAVAFALAWRLAAAPAPATRRLQGALAGLAATASVIAFTVAGPLRPGWARRAGTPASLLAAGTVEAASVNVALTPPAAAPSTRRSAGSSTSPTANLDRSFRASVTGTLTQSEPDASGAVTVRVDTTLRGDVAAVLSFELQGPASPGGGVEMRRSAVAFGQSSDPSHFQGQIVGLDGTQVVAEVRDNAGNTMTVSLRLQIDGTTVSGTAVGQPGAASVGGNDSGSR